MTEAAGDVRSRVGEVPPLRLGSLSVDRVDQAGALTTIATLVERRTGGRVFTPNLDHIRLAAEVPAFHAAYSRAALSVADGMPLVWASRWFGTPLPERVSGSDLMEPLCRLAAARGWRVFFLGGDAGVAEEASRRLHARCGMTVAGCLAPFVRIDDRSGDADIIATVRATEPHIVFVSLGSPKQELWIDRVADALSPAVLIGVGAGVDFIAGRVKRAPRWMQRAGLEWLFRLLAEPARLSHRYLVAGPRAVWYLLRTPSEAAFAPDAARSLPRSPSDGA